MKTHNFFSIITSQT
ncbi:hypothetical protein CFC21_016182, partial [Triticum aestivum]